MAHHLDDLKEKIKQDDPTVIFFNGRINRVPQPWFATGVTDQYGTTYRFKEIPLNKPTLDTNGDFVPDTYNSGGKEVTKTWGKHLDLTSARQIRLHPIVHANVIEKLRMMRDCVTSKKPPGYPKVKQGILIEHEPDVKEQEELGDILLEAKADELFLALKKAQEKGEPVWYYITALLNITRGSEASKIIRLRQFSKESPQKLLKYFAEEGSTELLQEYVNEAIVKIALDAGKIKLSNAMYYLGNHEIGSNLSDVYGNLKLMASVKHEVDKMPQFAKRAEPEKVEL